MPYRPAATVAMNVYLAIDLHSKLNSCIHNILCNCHFNELGGHDSLAMASKVNFDHEFKLYCINYVPMTPWGLIQ